MKHFERVKNNTNTLVIIDEQICRIIGYCYDDYGDCYIAFNVKGEKKYFDLLSSISILSDLSYDSVIPKVEKFITENYRSVENKK